MEQFKQILTFSSLIVLIYWIVVLSARVIINKKYYYLWYIACLSTLVFPVLIAFFFHYEEYIAYYYCFFPAVFSSFLSYPFLYLFMVRITSEKRLEFFRAIKHFIFPVIVFCFASYNSYSDISYLLHADIPSVSSKLSSLRYSGMFNSLIVQEEILMLIFLFFTIFYLVLIDRRVKNHQNNIENYFSNTEGKELRWYRRIRLILFSSCVVIALYYLGAGKIKEEASSFFAISNAIPAFFIWSLSYFIDRQKETYPEEDVIQSALSYSSTVAIGQESTGVIDQQNLQYQLLSEQLECLMDTKRLFIDGSITLPVLASKLGTNRTYLSQFFNDYLSVNFKQYINSKRIDYAKELLAEEKRYAVEEVYLMCGFNSSSSFYNVFSNLVNMTPTQYKQMVSEKK